LRAIGIAANRYSPEMLTSRGASQRDIAVAAYSLPCASFAREHHAIAAFDEDLGDLIARRRIVEFDSQEFGVCRQHHSPYAGEEGPAPRPERKHGVQARASTGVIAELIHQRSVRLFVQHFAKRGADEHEEKSRQKQCDSMTTREHILCDLQN